MRTSTVVLALAVLLALACAVTLGAASGEGDDPGTSASVVSPRGDTPRPARRVAQAEEAEESDEEDEARSDPQEAEVPDPPEPPRRALRIVDGDGDPVAGVTVAIVSADAALNDSPLQSTTGADGEASFRGIGTWTKVVFFDGDAERKVELRDSMTQTVVRGLPTLLVSAVDARSGNALDPVRFRYRCSWEDGREAWTGGKPPALAVTARGAASCSVDIDPPAGYGGYRTAGWSGQVALRARTARLVVPLFEATERTFRALDRDGGSLRGAVVESATADAEVSDDWRGGRAVTFESTLSAADGLVRVTGLPRIPFTRIKVRLAWRADGEGEESLGGTAEAFDPCAEPSREPVVVVLGRGGSYRGPAGNALG